MKTFIIKLLIFSFILVFYLGLNTGLNFIIINNSKMPIREADILIAGDSHTQKALNPSQFNSAINISQTAEPYVLTFWKLKYIFQHFKPDVLLLGFGHHNISAFNDMKFWNKKWSSEMFRRSYLIHNFNSIKTVKIDYQEYYKICFRQMCLYPHNKHYNFIGGYSNNDKSDLSDCDSAINRHYFYQKKLLGVSETAIDYLDLILKLCKENEVVPILIGSPVHDEYYKLIPTSIKERYNYEKARLRDQRVNVLDFTHNRYEDTHYLNSDHLNEKGASQFTDKIIRSLKNVYL